ATLDHPSLALAAAPPLRGPPSAAGNAGCARSPYGDDWPTWKADFFAPAAPALRAAPWIVVRGNHQICRRAGPGYFRLLDPTPAQTAPTQTPPCVELIPHFTITLAGQS